ncbi:MAG: ABC transporter substrate-binding protein [Spirochaetes bacterium]|nr:ABC transporter substrate-binding protein [Spirochaetota bacterium]MBU1079816.1 ABC transporter substrate-binding protein [Spirochaetota bacterium]
MRKTCAKVLSLGLVALGLLSPVFAMGGKEQAPTKLKIVSQMFYDPAQQQFIKEQILPKFTAETGVEVELQVVANASELYKTLQAQKETGKWTTDILIAHDSTAVTAVQEYQAVRAYDKVPAGTYITQFDDNFVQGGKRYFVPLQADVYLTIANRKALPYLAKLGYDINELTWTQLAEWVNLIKRETGSPKYVFPALAGKFATYEFNAVQLAYGASYVPVFNTPAAMGAFKAVAAMKDGILPSSQTIDFPTASLVTEEAWITVFHQAYANASFSQAPDKFVVAPVPKGGSGKRGSIIGGHGIGVVAGSANKAAADKFIEFFLRDDILYSVMRNTGPWIPSKAEVTSRLKDDPADSIMRMGLATLTGPTLIDRVRVAEFQDWGQVKRLYEQVIGDILAGTEMTQGYLDQKQAELEKLRIK